MIYFDNAATTLMKPPTVAEAVARAITSFGGVGRGVYESSIAAGMAVFETRTQIAELFNAPSAKDVAFTANATEALNIIVSGLLQSGDHVITTAASHNSVLRPLYRKQEQGCELSILPVSPDGSIDYDEFESLFKPNTRLALLTHASNLTGDVYDIETMAQICRTQGVLSVIDTAQTAGHVSIDMQEAGIDILVFTGHKSLFGPQGTGGLCLNGDIEIPPFMVGGSGTQSYSHYHPERMPERLEAGTLNSHGIAGLSAGLAFIKECGLDAISTQTEALVSRFQTGVDGIDGLIRYGRQDGSLGCGIVALNIRDEDSALVSDRLSSEYGICTRAGAHCAPLMHEALGTVEQGIVRFSFTLFNTEEEVDRALEALREIAR